MAVRRALVVRRDLMTRRAPREIAQQNDLGEGIVSTMISDDEK